MSVLGIDEIITLNRQLEPLGYRLHLHDACGGQAFHIEDLHTAADEPAMRTLLAEFFARQHMNTVYYGEGQWDFTAK